MEGVFRVTLDWTGDDNYALAVETPGGAVIEEDTPHDADTRGSFIGDDYSSQSGAHVESVFFPWEAHFIAGTYSVTVSVITQTGNADSYTLSIYYNGEIFSSTTSSTVDTEQFTFEGTLTPSTAPSFSR